MSLAGNEMFPPTKPLLNTRFYFAAACIFRMIYYAIGSEAFAQTLQRLIDEKYGAFNYIFVPDPHDLYFHFIVKVFPFDKSGRLLPNLARVFRGRLRAQRGFKGRD